MAVAGVAFIATHIAASAGGIELDGGRMGASRKTHGVGGGQRHHFRAWPRLRLEPGSSSPMSALLIGLLAGTAVLCRGRLENATGV